MIMNSEWICLREHLSWKSSFLAPNVLGNLIQPAMWMEPPFYRNCGNIVGYKWDINGITKRGYIISPEYDEKEPAFVVYKKSSSG